jgi:hypothetical protein
MRPLAIGRRLTSPAEVHDFGKRLLKHEERKKEGTTMRVYSVRYYIGSMYHAHIETAENEYAAIEKVLRRIPDTSRELLHDFKIERHMAQWN